MKALFQVAIGPCKEHVELTRARHQKYCDYHGYEYLIFDGGVDIDSYYAKFLFARQLIVQGYEKIVCLDADTIIQSLDADFSDAISGPQEIYAAECEIAVGDYSTGVMVFRNTGRSLGFIDAVLEFGSRHRTVYCDQGAFNAVARYVVEYQGVVCKIDRKWNSLYNNGDDDKVVVAFHGADNKLYEMEKYIEKIEGVD